MVVNSEVEDKTHKMEQSAEVNGHVYRYLNAISTKVAKLFKRECKTEILDDPSSPSICEIIKTYNSGEKRKMNGSANGTPAKKSKMNGKAKKEESEDSSDEESEEEAPKTNGKGNRSKLVSPSLSHSDSQSHSPSSISKKKKKSKKKKLE